LETKMLFTLAAIIGILWLIGMLTSATFGGLLHLLLIVTVVLVLVRLFSRPRAV